MTLLGAKVRFLWPDGGTADSLGEISHVSWGEDARPGLFVRWEYPGTAPRESFVADPSWLVTEDGAPLVVPPRTVTVQTAGGWL